MKIIKWTVIIIILLSIQGYSVYFVNLAEAKTEYHNRFPDPSHKMVCLLIETPDSKEFSDPLGKDLSFFIAEWSRKLPPNKGYLAGNGIILADRSFMLAQETETDQESHSSGTTESLDFNESKDLLEEESFDEEFSDDELFQDTEFQDEISDPFEPVNRFFFQVNDKLYFWILKPVAKSYGYVVPSPLRKGIRNFFTNLAFPIRFVNCILQAKFIRASEELGLFAVNSTAGIGGIFDLSGKFDYKRQEEDFGQTLGVLGFSSGFYICWPVLGPSSLRDSFGLAGDYFLDPLTYVKIGTTEYIIVRSVDLINDTSFSIGDYEALVDSALDPYIAMRNAYQQYRKSKISE